jgi:hypothetical protein
MVNITEKNTFRVIYVKIRLNWATVNLVLAAGLTVFTEILFLNYLRYRQGYIVAYCYLLWAMVAWYYMIRKRINTLIRWRLKNNE